MNLLNWPKLVFVGHLVVLSVPVQGHSGEALPDTDKTVVHFQPHRKLMNGKEQGICGTYYSRRSKPMS